MRGLYITATALLVQEARLETTSNNLANLRSSGFKKDRTVTTSFGEWLVSRRENRGRTGLPLATGAPTGKMPHGAAVSEVQTDFASGLLDATGRPLDLAVIGAGYFQVETPDGFGYTRNGHFMVDAEGFLVTAAGLRVWGEDGPITIGDNEGEISISPEGLITVGDTQVGQIYIAVFPSDRTLIKAGQSLFVATAPPLTEDEAGGGWEIWSGYLEGSNVDLAREMVALIEIQRSYEAVQRAYTTCDTVLKKAANELGNL